MSMSYDAVVIGAGIVGAACAWELAQAGMRTAIIEEGIVGGGATAAGMGHVVIMDDSPAQFALTRYSQSLWTELAPQLPADAEYDRCGTLWIAADEDEMQEVYRKCARFTSSGIGAEILDPQSLADAEPNLRRPLTGALRVPSDAVLHAPGAAAYLIAQAQEAGATLYLGSRVESAKGGNVLLADGSSISTAQIIHATGASAAELLPQLQIRKRKGHVVITDDYPNFAHHQIVELGYLKSAHAMESDSVAFNVQPRRSGKLLIGSSRQFDQESADVDVTILASMLARASEYMPALSSLSDFHVRTGFRAATPDKLPLIGPTEDPTVFLATGHEGLGITTSFATARLLTDHLIDRASPIPIDPYLPLRFARKSANV
ncbi:MAG TPA: FAD-dependent oxidoreductase [Alloacidobacterium sp.]|nr:FAD-dependent oxidoreductase [Alloacidobacterium sp.]